jgi:hypothetical protein
VSRMTFTLGEATAPHCIAGVAGDSQQVAGRVRRAWGKHSVSSPTYWSCRPMNQQGNVMQIAGQFEGEDKLVQAVSRLQTLLYAA